MNGLDVGAESGVIVTPAGADMASAILGLIAEPARRRHLERLAREAAERTYSWDRIGEAQRALYEDLIHGERSAANDGERNLLA